MSDLARVTPLRLTLAATAGLLALAALVGASASASAGPRACTASVSGYTYAGHQATYRGHGVRATITALQPPRVRSGHVAGWVGVGGPGQGPNGADAWIQAGMASVPGAAPFSYVEIARPGSERPELRVVEEGLAPGRPHRFAVLEMGRRPGWWRVWIDGQPMTEPILLPGSHGRWAPIATAESFAESPSACNAFSFRFEGVAVSYGGGGSWRPFVSGHRFLDAGNELRQLASAESRRGVYARRLSSVNVAQGPLPYAFLARSGS
ncbi:MAG: hypothetical protein RMM28_03940 [Thermoleophilia bacterium]|nr:hypothetical protein [Gaiellaceae bacterium]MDW8338271.1 hypothetical protein [Thermoleophilia bacterium]